VDASAYALIGLIYLALALHHHLGAG